MPFFDITTSLRGLVTCQKSSLSALPEGGITEISGEKSWLSFEPLPQSTMSERRSQIRLVDSELVLLNWQEASTTLKQLGNVDDISLGGIRVRVDHAIPIGTPVTICYGFLDDGVLHGTVRHHSEGPAGHYLGIEFDGTSKDSALHFSPELLTRSV